VSSDFADYTQRKDTLFVALTVLNFRKETFNDWNGIFFTSDSDSGYAFSQ
jgi:hypothetical protein